VVINFHGGPEAQYQPSFSALVQYAANELGIAVLAPNVRGSSGYGKSFLLLDNGFKREDSVKDAGALLDWIAGQPELDASRVAVLGGSYGGYMVLAAMTHYNDRLKAGIDVVGISNFVTFLENTKDYRRDLRRVEYGDERDPEMRAHLQAISPLNHVEKITRPMLVVQGLNDPRVPASEAEQIVAAIRANGGEAWYLLATDEGHGFRKKSNRDYYYWTMVLFLEKHLLPGEPLKETD
jgi:dipeptidyl aminopeptidase/acylaminoacyl peptidase